MEPANPSIIASFLEDLEGKPSIILRGNRPGFARLAADLAALAGHPQSRIKFGDLDYVALENRLDLTVHRVADSIATGMTRQRSTSKHQFAWNLEPEMLLEVAEKIAVLATSPDAGHQYLGARAIEDAQVIAAQDGNCYFTIASRQHSNPPTES